MQKKLLNYLNLNKRLFLSNRNVQIPKCLAWLCRCYHYHWLLLSFMYISSYLLFFCIIFCSFSHCQCCVERPTVGRRAPRSVICSAHSAPPGLYFGAKFKTFRYGLILKAIQKSLNHLTDWPCVKVKLVLIVSKVCILAYIECRA